MGEYFLRMSRAKRLLLNTSIEKPNGFSMMLLLGPSWRSSTSIPKRCRTTATSASHFLEDAPSEINIFEDPKVSPAISTSQFSQDVSGETLIFGIRGLKTAHSTSHFFEDVSGESPIFGDPKISRPISTSRFLRVSPAKSSFLT